CVATKLLRVGVLMAAQWRTGIAGVALMATSVGLWAAASPPQAPARESGSQTGRPAVRAALDRYCVGCHNSRAKAGGLALDALDAADVAGDAVAWEKGVRKPHRRQKPPARAHQRA